MKTFLEEAKKSSRTIANLSTSVKNRVLNEMADALMNHCDFIISHNEKDMIDARVNNLSEALQDNNWYNVMKEEIEKIEKNKTWTLVPRLVDNNVIGNKWVFRNMLDENGEIIRNKSRLVYKGYAQEEGM